MTGEEGPFLIAGDGDPFPWASLGSRWVKGTGTFSAFQFQSLVTIAAMGMVRLNYAVKLVAAPIRIFPPQYGLFFLVPDIVLPAERPFVVEAHFFSKQKVPSVICWDAKGRHDVKIVQLAK